MGKAVAKLNLSFNYLDNAESPKRLETAYSRIFQWAYQNLIDGSVITKTTSLLRIMTFEVDGVVVDSRATYKTESVVINV